LVFFFLCAIFPTSLPADWQTPQRESPWTDFFLPYRSPDGKGDWDASGSDPELLTQTHAMHLRNLSIRILDRAMDKIPRLAIESPSAQYDSKKNQFAGMDFIHVKGDLFTAVGGQWTFFGGERHLLLEDAVQVFLETKWDLENPPSEGSRTAIGGQNLQITVEEDVISLHFLGGVSLHSSGFTLDSDKLVVEIAREEPMRILGQNFTGETVRFMRAVGAVRINWPTHSIAADCAQIFPNDGAIFLSGNVVVLEGEDRIQCQGELLFRGGTCHVLAEGSVDLQFLGTN
jgi:hypothetical protein